jgi:hypothetical protein
MLSQFQEDPGNMGEKHGLQEPRKATVLLRISPEKQIFSSSAGAK